MANIKLICFPYAGGSSAIYYEWQPYLRSGGIDLIPFELQGRGRKLGEALHTRMDLLIDQAVAEVMEIIGRNRRYSFFGHSMGGLIAFEMVKKLMEAGFASPERLFISAKSSPCSNHLIEKYSKLNDEALLEKLYRDGGVNEEFVRSVFLQEAFLPIIRADYELIETYKANLSAKVDCPITVFYGDSDKITSKEISLWENYTHADTSFIAIGGGHFFIRDRYPEVIQHINDQLYPDNVNK
ncbi:thioesterase II family protein [Paenibacillus pinihumi]|uniref:thioesterase II family protein n=1 Tax=Paenibacillus pinihumi TaxID=669462 RepID=UPI000687C58B|nr:thioesterase domain-containing protein [Paenibacillus pinihumi]